MRREIKTCTKLKESGINHDENTFRDLIFGNNNDRNNFLLPVLSGSPSGTPVSPRFYGLPQTLWFSPHKETNT